MEFPTIDEFAKNVAEKALDEFIYEGKTIREWVEIIDKQQPCEDAISREAVIRLVEQYPNIIGNRCSGLIADIKHLPSVTPWSDWIPVSEKLPEPLTAVLLTVRYKSTGHWTYQMGYWEDTLERWEKWLEAGTLEEKFEVVAWMELPESYWEDDYE